MDGFKSNVYQYAQLTVKIDQFTIQIHETEDESPKKPPLYDLTTRYIAYESTLRLNERKLFNRIGMRYLALKQLHVMDGDLQGIVPQPVNKRNLTTSGPSSVLGSILKNEPRMIRANPSGISNRNPMALSQLTSNQIGMKSLSRQSGVIPKVEGTTNNLNPTKSKRGLASLIGGNPLDQSMLSENQYPNNILDTNSRNITPNIRSPRVKESEPRVDKTAVENTPTDNSFYGMFTSMLGIKKAKVISSPKIDTKM